MMSLFVNAGHLTLADEPCRFKAMLAEYPRRICTIPNHGYNAFALIQTRNRTRAKAVDGHSRSEARYQLSMMHTLELITDEDLQRFGLFE